MEKNTSASARAEGSASPVSIWPATEASGFAPSWFLPPGSDEPPVADPDPWRSPARLWTNLMRARVLIAVVLLLLQVFIYLHEPRLPWLLVLCAAYIAATVAVLRWGRPRSSDSAWSPRWAMTLWMDVAMFGVLQYFQQGNLNYTALFVLPVLLAAILGPLLLALGSAAAGTLLLLWDAWSVSFYNPSLATGRFLQSALTGGGLFLVALLAHQLASRLVREHAQAQRSQALARTQTDVNSLIVTGLKEGVLVVDAAGTVWHANPAARAMLGANPHADDLHELAQTPGWPLLTGWIQGRLAFGGGEDGELAIPATQAASRKLRVRARLTPGIGGTRACVVFMEDLRDVEARVQTEKLAAMGRVSAAVAHEIRNPLAAIAQANDLLDEDTTDPTHKRLTTMIGQNVRRLGRTVDDILDVVRPLHPVRHSPAATVVLDDSVAQAVADWQQLRPQGDRLACVLTAPGTHVPFEDEHLRRVLVNLLDNADRYASSNPGAIRVSTSKTGNSHAPTLSVWSHGPELDPQVRQHLFEPFVSSHSRSSGLGLYICRELCERYGATLGYERQAVGTQVGNAFVVRWPTPHNAT